MVAQQRSAARVAAGGTPHLMDENLLAVAPVAVILIAERGRVVHWNHVAAEMFGTPSESAVGRPLRSLLRLPHEHRAAFEFGGPHIRHVWTGVCLVPPLDDGPIREVAWWVYPLAGPHRLQGLAIAADACRLRDAGPGLALGDVLMVPPPRSPLTSASGIRVLRVEPTLLHPSASDSAVLGRRLAELLPPRIADLAAVAAHDEHAGGPAPPIHDDDAEVAGDATAPGGAALLRAAADGTAGTAAAARTAETAATAGTGGTGAGTAEATGAEGAATGSAATAGTTGSAATAGTTGSAATAGTTGHAQTSGRHAGHHPGQDTDHDSAVDRIVEQVIARGCPAVNVSLTARLPFAAHRDSRPRMTRVRVAAPAWEPHAADPLERAAAQERLDFLNDAGARIVDTLDPAHTAAVLCDALVPRFADYAEVQLLDWIVSDRELPPARPPESPSVVRVAVRYDEEQGSWDHLVPEWETLRLPAETPFADALSTGRSHHIPRVGERLGRRIAAELGGRDLRSLVRGRALLVTPLIARGTVLGNIVLMRRRDRPPFGEPDVTIVEELGRRAAVSVDNGRLYRREARVAAELQHSMLPDAPPVVAGARICYRYVPANEAVRVGGDWFDAIPLPGGRLALVVGDVMGHGLTSAAVMGQLRTAVRTLAAQDLPPDRLLRQLDDLAQRLGDETLATCVYVVYDPVARRCEVANAGHLPPVLISPAGEARVLEVRPGAPVGVGGVAFETVAFDAPDGSRLVLCTDGLVERRGQGIDVGLAAMREILTGPPRPLEGVCDTLIDGLCAGGRPDDDIALLAVRFEGIASDDVRAWAIAASPTMVRHARRLARQALGEWDLAELSDTVELLVSELVTNAVKHGAGDVGLRLIRANSLLCEVRDDGHELPHLRRAEATDENGRGLQLVSALAERWGTQRTPTGKVVWFEQGL